MAQQKPSEKHFFSDMPGVHEAYIHTNFGSVHPDWLHRGVEWGAIRYQGEHYDYAVYMDDRGVKLSVFFAYLECMRRENYWYTELKSYDAILLWKRLVLDLVIPMDYVKKFETHEGKKTNKAINNL